MSRFIIAVIFFIGFIVFYSACQDAHSADLKGVEYLSGYGEAQLKQKGDYRVIPFMVGFNFDLKPLTQKVGFNPSSTVQFQIEPFLGNWMS